MTHKKFRFLLEDRKLSRKSYIIIAATLLILGLSLAVTQWHINDDAFISFRYAKNLAAGRGLVYNPGELVKGYTNFLWTMIIALGIKIGQSPVALSLVLGILFFLGTMLLCLKISSILTDNLLLRLLPLALLASSKTAINWATGGLETSLCSFLLLSGIFFFLKNKLKEYSTQNTILQSLSFTLAMMTRPDAALITAVFSISFMVDSFRKTTVKESLRRMIFLAAPFLLIYLPYFLWRYNYYGFLFPNTFYAKNAGKTHFKLGFLYLKYFFRNYPLFWIIPAAAAVYYAASRLIRKRTVQIIPGALPLIFSLLLFFFYIFKVGGDFMSFRFMAPVFPVFYFLIVISIRPIKRKTLISVLILSISIAGFLTGIRLPRQIESIQSLRYHIKNQRWDRIGKYLKKRLPSDTVIATTAAGAGPFYSGLTTIDILGLTDHYVAQKKMDNADKGSTIGHSKYADRAYLKRRKVNLVFSFVHNTTPFSATFPKNKNEVVIKLWGNRAVTAQLLTKTDKLEKLFKNQKLYHYQIYKEKTPKEILPGKIITSQWKIRDFLDPGNAVSEKKHSVNCKTIIITRMFEDARKCLIEDECRVIKKDFTFAAGNLIPNKDLALVIRSDFWHNCILDCMINGKAALRTTIEANTNRERFEYRTVIIPGKHITKTNQRISLSVKKGRDFAPFFIWIVQHKKSTRPVNPEKN